MINQHAATFAELEGKMQCTSLLAAKHAKMLFLLGATFSIYDKAFLDKILKVPKAKIIQFESMQQIIHPERCETDDDIVKYVVLSLKDAFAKFAEIINEIGQKPPLLVFIEDETEDIDTKLRKIVEKASISYQKVDDVETAMTAKASLINESKCVVRVTRRYARGYDIRFRCDSTVVIIGNGNRIDLSEIQQMVGRSSRTQNEMSGVMIIIDEAKKSLQQNWALIKKRNSTRDQKPLMNLLPLYTSEQAKLTPLMDKLA